MENDYAYWSFRVLINKATCATRGIANKGFSCTSNDVAVFAPVDPVTNQICDSPLIS